MKAEIVHTLTDTFEANTQHHFVGANKMVLGTCFMLTNNPFSKFPGVMP